MKKYIILSGVIFFMSFFNCKGGTKNSAINISPNDLYTALQTDSIQLIDVRTPKEYQAGFIKTAQNIDYKSSNFSTNIEALNKQKPVYIYCRSGKRSEKSIKIFQEAGFEKIYNLEGGILNWKQKGLDIFK
ncbi:hypothetical protein BWZ22_02170 [Seonamhaeicola sp. S2-3]|uniref:rhodanese-like domain-containing protein n=1 Tax=Seonamhaeicola sp. S2-3 TaxID=1936081 RepID=UPI000972E23A|nr:rhodanese-like domain-containing protein [Seonamhaeicola sp. S2-3]APY10109.1 hypothetical protein BWZ22_02170 [Seonamhaeicola sp. S2-3]